MRKFKNEKAFSKWLKADLIKTYGKQIKIINITATGYGEAGVHDFICCVRGTFLTIELKQEGKELTALQERFAEDVLEAKGVVLAPMWPSKVDALYEMLDQIMNIQRRTESYARQKYSETLADMEAKEALAQELPPEITRHCDACERETIHVPQRDNPSEFNCVICAAVQINKEIDND